MGKCQRTFTTCFVDRSPCNIHTYTTRATSRTSSSRTAAFRVKRPGRKMSFTTSSSVSPIHKPEIRSSSLVLSTDVTHPKRRRRRVPAASGTITQIPSVFPSLQLRTCYTNQLVSSAYQSISGHIRFFRRFRHSGRENVNLNGRLGYGTRNIPGLRTHRRKGVRCKSGCLAEYPGQYRLRIASPGPFTRLDSRMNIILSSSGPKRKVNTVMYHAFTASRCCSPVRYRAAPIATELHIYPPHPSCLGRRAMSSESLLVGGVSVRLFPVRVSCFVSFPSRRLPSTHFTSTSTTSIIHLPHFLYSMIVSQSEFPYKREMIFYILPARCTVFCSIVTEC